MLKVELNNGKIVVRSDYDSRFVRKAKEAGGKWRGKAWIFDEANLDIVKKICMDIYGEDGFTPVEKVTVEVNLDKTGQANRQEISLFGRVLARRFSRDSYVKLHSTAVVVEGNFPTRGGSVKNPRIEGEGVVLRVTDVPLSLAEGVEGVTIIGCSSINIAELEAEKELLKKRIEEIDAILAKEQESDVSSLK